MNDHMHVDDPAVAAVLAAAAAPAEGPVPGEAAALAAFRSVHHPQRRLRMSRFSDKAKLIAAAVFGGVVVISGAATAATGGLPLVSHGHGHGHGHGHSHVTPDTSGAGDDQSGDTGDDSATPATKPTHPANHGNDVSGAAHNKTVTGKNHGQDVCIVASAGKCHSGGQSDATTHGKSALPHGKAHQNTNSSTHRQNTATTHGKAALPHGKAHQNGHTSG